MAKQYEVRNVRTIETVARLDEHFRSNEVGNERNPDLIIEKCGGLRILEPVVGDRRHKIRRTKYQVNIQLSLEDLCNPTLVLNLRLVPQRSEFVQNLGIVTCFAENIDVFCR